MLTNHNSTTKYDKQTVRTVLQNKLLCLMKMVLSALLVWNTNLSTKPWDYRVGGDWKGINSMGLRVPLDELKPNNSSETPNCHQNLEIIALKNWKVWSQWSLVSFWPTIKPTILLKHQTVTKILIWFPWSQSIKWWRQVQPHNRNPRHKLPQACGGSKFVWSIWIWTT